MCKSNGVLVPQKCKPETWTPPDFDPKQTWPSDLLDPKHAQIGGNKPEV